jgi:hypothetical protein
MGQRQRHTMTVVTVVGHDADLTENPNLDLVHVDALDDDTHLRHRLVAGEVGVAGLALTVRTDEQELVIDDGGQPLRVSGLERLDPGLLGALQVADVLLEVLGGGGGGRHGDGAGQAHRAERVTEGVPYVVDAEVLDHVGCPFVEAALRKTR